jgi:LmbE family N-acetylglucosaminyl deacetylase/CheY-like chemotaxis protein
MSPDGLTDPARATVLLVEDDEVLADFVATLLAELADVTTLGTAEEAAVAIRGREFDLVVTDIGLPGASGIEVVALTRDVRPTAATLVISASTRFEDAVAAIRAGADDYLAKPLEPGSLREKVRELLERAASRRRSADARRDRVLAVGAHPDDVEIGVGGVLLRHADAGDAVTVLTLTGGEVGGPPEQRAGEAAAAAEMLGARLVQLGLADTNIGGGDGAIAALERVVRDLEPTTIYTHTACDVHQDHRNVHDATLVAARGVPRVYCYESPSTTVEFRPTRFVSIDDVLDRKLEVLRAYSSQTSIRRYLAEDLLVATARYWSRFGRTRYAEPLEVVRESDVHGAG